MITIKVTNCAECPFCNNDMEYGLDRCNLNTDIFMPNPFKEEMPSKDVHLNCPLKYYPIVISL